MLWFERMDDDNGHICTSCDKKAQTVLVIRKNYRSSITMFCNSCTYLVKAEASKSLLENGLSVDTNELNSNQIGDIRSLQSMEYGALCYLKQYTADHALVSGICVRTGEDNFELYLNDLKTDKSFLKGNYTAEQIIGGEKWMVD